MTNNISTFLWFDSNAADAAKMYCEIFPGAKITGTMPTGVAFEINGQRFSAFNGGPTFKLTPAVSIMVSCKNQEEVDAIWNRFLAAGGTESKCGWLTDKYGLSWQVIPTQLIELMTDPDPVKANRVVQAMLKMQKIDVAELQRAYRG